MVAGTLQILNHQKILNINFKIAIYDLNLDKKLNKLGEGKKLELYDMNKLPPYIKENKKKFEGWLD